jgi:alpha-beta hydrolase superfamily lysophospholipase
MTILPVQTISLSRADGIELFASHWPTTNARGHVHIAHGLAEHGARYARLAAVLNARGLSVTASDHRGHGLTARNNGIALGDAGAADCWNTMVDDLAAWWQLCLDRFCTAAGAHIPLLVLGHSLGGFMTLQAACVSALPLSGIALSAIGTRSRVFSLLQARLIRLLPALLPKLVRNDGDFRTSAVVEWASFGRFNSAFRPNRTAFDWLSRDEAQVDAYIADEFCGQPSSLQLWADFLAGVARLQSRDMQARLRSDTPMLLLSGTQDPVGAFGKAMPALAACLRRAGVSDVRLRMFNGARHELLNEINAAEVEDVLCQWIESVLQNGSDRRNAA